MKAIKYDKRRLLLTLPAAVVPLACIQVWAQCQAQQQRQEQRQLRPM